MEYRPSQFFTSKKSALVIAHPGHELRVLRWLELARPTVFVLTDGSGRSGTSRLESTITILETAQAQRGIIFGLLTDLVLYHKILEREFDFFIDLAEKLAEHLYQHETEYVAGDAIEGYNPAHDTCRLVIDAATRIVRYRHKVSLRNFDFVLSGPPHACPETAREKAIWIHLDDQQFERKLNFALRYPELGAEVESALAANGKDAFRIECLRPVEHDIHCYHFQKPPFYERYGEKQVAAGLYDRVIRYREHMLPVAQALNRHVERVAKYECVF